jgi:dTDP-4-amino-4,6-dideoxygalactose transaminase
MAQRISRQKAFGVDRHMGERTVPGVYDVTMLGFNYRMNEIQAALGIEQLKRMNDFLRKREENYQALSSGLGHLEEISLFKSSHGEYQSSYYCQSVLLKGRVEKKRYEVVTHLKEHGVGTSVYYPKPVPHMAYYREKYGYEEGSFPVAAKISATSIALPVGPHLGVEDMHYVVECLKNAIVEVK